MLSRSSVVESIVSLLWLQATALAEHQKHPVTTQVELDSAPQQRLRRGNQQLAGPAIWAVLRRQSDATPHLETLHGWFAVPFVKFLGISETSAGAPVNRHPRKIEAVATGSLISRNPLCGIGRCPKISAYLTTVLLSCRHQGIPICGHCRRAWASGRWREHAGPFG